MARLTILPTETDAVSHGKTDSTRPEPQASTPPPTHASEPISLNAHPDNTIQPDPSPQGNHTGDHTRADATSCNQTSSTGTITFIARTDEDLIAALQLISDSVAQQHQIAARALLTHPAYWSFLLLTIPYFYVEWYHDTSDWPFIIVTWVGVLMSTMAVIKWVVRGYLDAAERVGRWSWLYGDQWVRNRFGRSMSLDSQTTRGNGLSNARVDCDPDFKIDYVFVTKEQDKIIAALVIRMTKTWTLNSNPTPHTLNPSTRKTQTTHLQKKALIRAWTVEQRYRGKGIGTALLRFVVRWCVDNEIDGPEFSESHVHSLRLLPEFLNRQMNLFDRRAREKVFWETRHYVSVKELQRELDEGKRVETRYPGKDGVDVGDWVSPGPGPRGVLSPRKRVQMSRAITRQILKGD